ncbi:outer membrane protein insertion porin family [Thermophagus xiamenensis]|uniref:Outer membrane protein insertion porin family n=2 Tax=Thermophagus xiamenensis TaxID=385682 RepID=A0A1I1YQL2_9BACT|nr:outer membrane protein insertion porin family [Thermophagus xiamenensis]
MDKIDFTNASWVGKTFFKKEPSYYSSDAWELNKARLVSFYQMNGFLQVKVELKNLKKISKNYRVDLTIAIDEGTPVIVRSVFFTGVKGTERDTVLLWEQFQQLKQELIVKEGSSFRDDAVRQDQKRITEWFASRGYAYVEVQPDISLSSDTLFASINWLIEKGPLCRFGEVTIVGNERVPLKAVEKQITFREGEIYNYKAISQSQKQVYGLGLFRIASFQTSLTNPPSDTLAVTVKTEEAPRLSTRVGVGYGLEEHFRTFLEMGYLSFPGKTMRTKFYAKHSGLEPYRFEAIITQPSIFGPNSSLEFNPSVRQRKEEGFESFLWGGDLSLYHNFGSRLTGSVSMFYERVDIEIASDFERSLEDMDQSTYSKNGFSVGMSFNNSMPKSEPALGWSLAVNAKVNGAIFNSPYPFFKYMFEGKRFQPVTNGVVLAMRLEAGNIIRFGESEATPVEERFFAGGSRSVRGWSRYMLGPLDDEGIPLGGNSLLEGSVEPRIKVVGPFSIVLFVDWGNVWSRESTFRLNEIHWSAGAGFRFATPIGPVGMDFARPVFDENSKWQIHLNVGHAF